MKKAQNYSASASKGLGAIHIICGLICIAINVASKAEGVAELYYLGIAGGILYVVTGGLGVLAGLITRKIVILIFLVLSVLSTMFAIAVLVLWSIEIDMLKERRESLNLYYAPLKVEEVIEKVAGLLCVTVVELVAAFGSVLICLGSFCCQPEEYESEEPDAMYATPVRPVVMQAKPARPVMMQTAPVYTVEKQQSSFETIEMQKSPVHPAVIQTSAVQPAVARTSPRHQPAEMQAMPVRTVNNADGREVTVVYVQ